MMRRWRRRFLAYAADPYAEWPTGRQRQAEKLIQGLNRTGLPPARVARQIVSIARKRARRRPVTLFVVNCGSSGSHWLTTMLNELPGVADCGEVYLPEQIMSELGHWTPADRTALIDCIHLSHAGSPTQNAENSVLINSAHVSGWRIARAYGAGARTVLLVRDPLDVAISRTFRKADYRSLIAAGTSDRDYLDRNIAFVKRFFASASTASYDLCVRYEDLRHRSVEVLSAICAATGVTASPEQLALAARRHGLYSPTTNSYRGTRQAPPPELVAHAASALASERIAWGYSQPQIGADLPMRLKPVQMDPEDVVNPGQRG